MRSRTLAILGTAVCVSVVGASLAVAGQGANATTKVNVTLKEFKVIPAPPSVKAGKVSFTVKNVGKATHELVVIKTSAAPGKLKVTGAVASEAGKVLDIPGVAPGKTKTGSVTLKKGKYVFICNVPGHYQAGQYVGFTVK
ncbi:MAG: cupredoxin domain-containing protein, partial [Actinomycetota bacterium]